MASTGAAVEPAGAELIVVGTRPVLPVPMTAG
jgi:hypothetical protein